MMGQVLYLKVNLLPLRRILRTDGIIEILPTRNVTYIKMGHGI